jgi:ribosomal peptide maturation radical SAM protein 1
MIHLVNMPFGSILHPSLALGQFKAQLVNKGIECRVHNLNFDFARRIGFANYEIIALLRGMNAQVGEWLFAQQAWGDEFGPGIEEFLRLCSYEASALHEVENPKEWFSFIRSEIVPVFLEECCERLLGSGEPQVVGFSCLFFQTVPSLALACRLKKLFPTVRIAFGGASFFREMGEELIKKVPQIDAVSVGEADDVIIPLFLSLLESREPKGLQGILYRRADHDIALGAPPEPANNAILESNPLPDFQDYFDDLKRVGLEEDRSVASRIFLPFESSRGCWWGQRHPCRFCGLNPLGHRYRWKSGKQMLRLLRGYVDRYPIRRLQAIDNIPPRVHYDELFPALKERPLGRGVELWYGIRTDTHRRQVRLLAEAGVHYLTPGIESLSTHLLECMNKGVTALENIYFLKLCRLYGIYPLWSFLYRIPGEIAEDYEEMVQNLPKIVHFHPPFGGPRKIEMHRFSPYFNTREKWAEKVRPHLWYSGIFPEDRIDISRIAYYFDCEWKDTLDERAYEQFVAAVWNWIDLWRESPLLPSLNYYLEEKGRMVLRDTRKAGQSGEWRLDRQEMRIYQEIEDPATPEKIFERSGGIIDSLDGIERILGEFIASGLAIREGDLYLGLALPWDAPEPSLSFRKRAFRRVGQEAERIAYKGIRLSPAKADGLACRAL